MARRSDGKFVLIRTKRDLAVFLKRRASEPGSSGGFWLSRARIRWRASPNLDALFDAGYRMMSFTHFFDNLLAGSAHGVEKGGLTERAASVARVEEKHIIVDLCHGSAKQIEDVL